MRNAFADELTRLASEDPRVVLLAGDIGNRLFDKFKAQSPDRFFNCGVAEANMVSVAAGMAECGLRPITYTINSFATTRCYEQIRVDVCYHNLPVIIVGVGGGLSYANLGGTHQSCEDIAIMRVLPNMTVICPADVVEVRQALRAAMTHPGPVYLRLGKKGEPRVHQTTPAFEIGRGIVVRRGTQVCLLGTGNMLPVALGAADELSKRHISVQVVSVHTVKPLDQRLLQEVFSTFPLVATVEEHNLLGGLGGSVAEWLTAQDRLRGRLLRFGTADAFIPFAGDQHDIRRHWGLTAEAIAERVERESHRSLGQAPA